MNEECKRVQERIIDEFYDENNLKKDELKHLNECDVCLNFRENLVLMENSLSRKPLEPEASEDELIFIEELVREHLKERNSEELSRHLVNELGTFIVVATIMMSLTGLLFYFDIGPGFIQIQIFGLFIFPLIIPIIGGLEYRGRNIKGDS